LKRTTLEEEEKKFEAQNILFSRSNFARVLLGHRRQ
jgi:hypothetical protein